MSKQPDNSFSTVVFTKLDTETPVCVCVITSQPAWKEIQETCPNLRKAASHIKKSTRLGKKEKNQNDVKKLISKATLSKDVLLIVRAETPMQMKSTELIVVPREFSMSILTLIHNDSNYDHPSENQMLELTKQKFYIFDVKTVIKNIYDNCIPCAARKKIPQSLSQLETQTKSSCPGTYCNADILKRNKQKILVLRDNLTSYTLTKLVNSETKDDLRAGNISLTLPMKPNMTTTIMVDPHTSFVSLKDNKLLKENGIKLQFGHEKNKTTMELPRKRSRN